MGASGRHSGVPSPTACGCARTGAARHDPPLLRELADRAASVGVERFVLDDGWFGGRRHDRAGLGDWTVSTDVWPEGLAPITDHVHGLGMQFGLWFEPEMVNLDSDLYRAHPDWILASGGRIPPEERHQQVLDLTQPGAYRHVLDQLTAVLSEHPVDYRRGRTRRTGACRWTSVRPRPGRSAARCSPTSACRGRRRPRCRWSSCCCGTHTTRVAPALG